MEMFFADPSEIPLPPAEVRIRGLKADPYPDGRRVRVYLEVDPFQRRPNAEITLTDQDGGELGGASVIESMNRKMEITLHLRRPAQGTINLEAVVYYSSIEEQPSEDDKAAGRDPIERTIVDTQHTQFQIGS